MTRLVAWTNRLYWVVCGGLILLTAGLAAERHLRRLTTDLVNPALAQVSEEVSGERRELDELREQVKQLAAKPDPVETPAPTPVVTKLRETAVSQAAGPTPAAVSAAKVAGPVNINLGTKEQLMDLPGIGASYAEKIIAGRPYASVDELTKVKGIGEKTLAKLRDQVTL
jgi:competence protein ComEA